MPSVSVCRLSAGKVEGRKDTPFTQRLVQVVGRYGIVLRIDDISAVLVDKSPHGAGLHGRMVVYEGIGIGKLSFYGDVAVTVYVCPFSSDEYRSQRGTAKRAAVVVARFDDGGAVSVAPTPFPVVTYAIILAVGDNYLSTRAVPFSSNELASV